MTVLKLEDSVVRTESSALLKSADLVGGLLGTLGRCWDQAQARIGSLYGSEEAQQESEWRSLPAVSSNDKAQAIQVLERAGRVDVQRFLEEIDPARLLSEPLGPTAVCLTMSDLDSDEPEAVTRVKLHVLSCDVCSEVVRAYALVKDHSRSAEQVPGAADIDFEFARGVVVDARVEFDLKVSTPPGVTIYVDTLSMEGPVEHIRCQQMQLLETDPLVGSSYVTRCLGTVRQDLGPSGLHPETLTDWIQLSGRASTGEAFSRRLMLTLSRRSAVPR